MDYLIKALIFNQEARVYLINNTNTINTAIKKHDLWPSATSVLGKTMTVAQMMGAMLKDDAALTIKINGSGPLGNIIVDSNAIGNVRGYVDHPHVSFVNNQGGINDQLAIGTDGTIDVIKDLKLKNLFTSSISLTGDLAQDFTYYFYTSEQTNSAVLLSIVVDVNNLCQTSGGMIIQLLPFAKENTISAIEKAINNIENINVLLQKPLTEILEILFFNNYEIIEQHDVNFFCPCSKESFKISLTTLGINELEIILKEDKQIETVCHYCNEKYLFNEKEIIEILEVINKKNENQ